MKFVASMVAICALLLSAGAVGAGQFISEIDCLAKPMASLDAGSGSTVGAPGSDARQHPPTSAMTQADQSSAASAAAAQTDKPQHPPTVAMNRKATGSTGTNVGTQGREEHPP